MRTLRVYGVRPPLTSTSSVLRSGRRAVASAGLLRSMPHSRPPASTKRAPSFSSPEPWLTSIASESPHRPPASPKPISSSLAPASNAKSRAPEGAMKMRTSGR